jgi:hypothetical protein
MMDPDVALADLRQLVELVNDEVVCSHARAAHASRAVELLVALDAHLTAGGAKPTAWACPDTLREAVGGDLAELLTGNPWDAR